MARVELPQLMMKLTCDRSQANRRALVTAHLNSFSKSEVEHCFWDLVAACPDQIDAFLAFVGDSTQPSLFRIKKLMTHYYEHFKRSDSFQEKFLYYPCVGEVDPLRKVLNYCKYPKKGLRASVTSIFSRVDVRAETIVRRRLPESLIQDMFAVRPTDSAPTIAFRAYDEQMEECRRASLSEQLTHWRGVVLLQMSKGARWAECRHLAPTFHETRNSDVAGIDARILAFARPLTPERPVGWYAFSEKTDEPVKKRNRIY